MAEFHKITYSETFKRANVYSHGCGFNCTWCSYRLKGNGKPRRFLDVPSVKQVLGGLDIDAVHFLGGEPTLCPGLAEVANFAKNELGVRTKIGHSTGINMPPENIDAVSVSIKSRSDGVHVEHTGASNAPVLENFARMYRGGIEVDASSVLIPGLIDRDEIRMVARFIAGLDRHIPYHIVGYVPVPEAPWRKPTSREVEEAKSAAEEHLRNVTSSCLSAEDFFNLGTGDIRYKSVRVA
jgi:pyruvate formate lyase activating enzyme